MFGISQRTGKLITETMVPVLMLVFLLAYWLQVARLSYEAKLFPGLVTGILSLMLMGSIYDSIREIKSTGEIASHVKSATLVRLLFIFSNIVLILLWPLIGVPLGVFLGISISMLIFGCRNLLQLLSVPLVASCSLYFVFAVVLSARLPTGSIFTSLIK